MSGETQRLDKWLWHARFFKTRTLAATVIGDGKVRVNGTRVSKPAHMVRPGDVLTFSQARRIRVVEMLATALRRGPAAEAQTLYRDLTPPADPSAPAAEPGGRPAKKERRALQQIRRIPT